MPSPTGALSSTFSPYSDSPNSPAPFRTYPLAEKRWSLPIHIRHDCLLTRCRRSSGGTDTLHPPPSPYPQHIDPSPVDSNGTENTEIEEEAQEDGESQAQSEANNAPDADVTPSDIEIISPESASSVRGLSSNTPRPLCSQRQDRILPLHTQLPPHKPADDEPQSVIHAPEGFKSFEDMRASQQSPTEGSENTVVSPRTPEAVMSPTSKVCLCRVRPGSVSNACVENDGNVSRQHERPPLHRPIYATSPHPTGIR